MFQPFQGPVAQPGSASRSQREGQGFKSPQVHMGAVHELAREGFTRSRPVHRAGRDFLVLRLGSARLPLGEACGGFVGASSGACDGYAGMPKRPQDQSAGGPAARRYGFDRSRGRCSRWRPRVRAGACRCRSGLPPRSMWPRMGQGSRGRWRWCSARSSTGVGCAGTTRWSGGSRPSALLGAWTAMPMHSWG